jgi:hypothetical protein
LKDEIDLSRDNVFSRFTASLPSDPRRLSIFDRAIQPLRSVPRAAAHPALEPDARAALCESHHATMRGTKSLS